MFYVTGDTQRDFDRIYDFCNSIGTTQEDDVLIVLGDACINYYLNEEDRYLKKELSEFPVTFLFVHGNHEERPYLIDSYDEIIWNEGIVYLETEFSNLLFAKDGEIYDIEGAKAIVIGGAYSIDKYTSKIWFVTEQPDEFIKEYVESKLEKVNWRVDYVFSHTAPLKYEPTEAFIPGLNQEGIDKTTEEWLDSIEDRLDYEKWFLGHYHIDTRIDRVTVMFEEFEDL